MYGWLVKRLTQAAARRLAQGDPSLFNGFTAKRVHFTCGGQHPFALDTDVREEVEQWWARLAHFRPRMEVHKAVAGGWPWNIQACVYFTDEIGDPSDGPPYINEGVCLLRIRWCKIVEERVFLDTQAAAEFFGTETPEEFFPENFGSRLASTDH